jgi:hypothetical protein
MINMTFSEWISTNKDVFRGTSIAMHRSIVSDLDHLRTVTTSRDDQTVFVASYNMCVYAVPDKSGAEKKTCLSLSKTIHCIVQKEVEYTNTHGSIDATLRIPPDIESLNVVRSASIVSVQIVLQNIDTMQGRTYWKTTFCRLYSSTRTIRSVRAKASNVLQSVSRRFQHYHFKQPHTLFINRPLDDQVFVRKAALYCLNACQWCTLKSRLSEVLQNLIQTDASLAQTSALQLWRMPLQQYPETTEVQICWLQVCCTCCPRRRAGVRNRKSTEQSRPEVRLTSSLIFVVKTSNRNACWRLRWSSLYTVSSMSSHLYIYMYIIL